MNADVNGALVMADIVLYGSSQDEQGFPPLLIRAMTFGIPIAVPDIPVITKYVCLITLYFQLSLKRFRDSCIFHSFRTYYIL